MELNFSFSTQKTKLNIVVKIFNLFFYQPKQLATDYYFPRIYSPLAILTSPLDTVRSKLCARAPT